jgi:uncharacterized protein
MSLKDQITEDMKAAMRAKDTLTLGTIRLLQSAIKQREVDERITLDDAAVIAIVDSVTAYMSAQREDLANQERSEMAILEAYLPQRMSDNEIEAEVQALITQLGASGPGDMGKVMGAAKTALTGKADMSLVSAAVKKLLK